MPIADEITQWSSKVHTDAYAMSIGELINLYEDKELDIHPEFQRFFRWSNAQKSRLIESILLGIPLPSIFVAQRDDGVWDVIDGLQRLSTVFQLVGVLRDENQDLVTPLTLDKTKYLPSLAGLSWESTDPVKALPAAEKLAIKRSKLDVKIIKKQSDQQTRYELFQRLNTGGSQLSDQEVRNCLLISIDAPAYRTLRELASSATFVKCCDLTERQTDEQYDLELVVRFFLLAEMSDASIKSIADIGEFLTDRMVEKATKKQLVSDQLKSAFVKTFDLLNTALGSEAFRKYSKDKARFEGGFLISGFEAVGLGLGQRFLTEPSATIPPATVVENVKRLWGADDFLRGIGSGKRASERMPVSVPFGRQLFKA
jgi:hypothetical protein